MNAVLPGGARRFVPAPTLALLALLAPLGAADERVLGLDCLTVVSPSLPTDHTAMLRVRRFDPQRRVLIGVELTLRATVEGTAELESLDPAPATIHSTLQAAVSLRRPDQTVLLEAQPATSTVDHATAFDGLIDFAGTSGVTHSGVQVETAQHLSALPLPSDLALFTGAPGAPGSVDLPLVANGSSTAGGPGNLVAQLSTAASVRLTVCYRYEPDCNQNGVPDGDDLLAGTSTDLDQDGVPDECQAEVASLCEGDGPLDGGLPCPCGNNGAPGEGCRNGTGHGGLLSAAGLASVSADSLQLSASNVPWNSPGFFFYAQTLAGGTDGVPFGHGINCLAFGTPVLKSDGGGTIPPNGAPPLSAFLGVDAGDVTYFQYWYRNVGGPCPGVQAVNTTNALEITWGP